MSGSVIAASVRQVAGQVGGRPFAAELPRAGEAGGPEVAATDDPAAIEAVPPATGNNAVITVKVGGDRVGDQRGRRAWPASRCSLYDGDPHRRRLRRVVHDLHLRRRRRLHRSPFPSTQVVGGTNRDRRFWVVRTGTPAGWFGLQHARDPGRPPTPLRRQTAYRFRTGTQLQPGVTYSSTANFMISSGTSRPLGVGRDLAERRGPTRRSLRGVDSESPRRWTCPTHSPPRTWQT